MTTSTGATDKDRQCPYSDRGLSQQQRFAWGVVAVLFCASVVNYIDPAVLGVVMPQIGGALHLNNQQYGWAVDAFLIAYTLSYIVGGKIADRFGCRRMAGLTTALWSVGGLAHACVSGLGALSLARAMLGLGEAAFYPAAMRGAAGWFSSKNRAKAVGLILSALSVGTLMTAPVVAWVARSARFAGFLWRHGKLGPFAAPAVAVAAPADSEDLRHTGP